MLRLLTNVCALAILGWNIASANTNPVLRVARGEFAGAASAAAS